MNKLQDLREYLLGRLPALKRNPEQLLTFVEDGKIIFHKGSNYSHQYRMPVRLIVTDWKGTADDIVLPLLEWVSVREPGWDPESILSFETEIIDKEKIDIAFTLQITERVIVRFEDGVRTIEHILPAPEMQMDEGAQWSFDVTGPNTHYTIPEDE